MKKNGKGPGLCRMRLLSKQALAMKAGCLTRSRPVDAADDSSTSSSRLIVAIIADEEVIYTERFYVGTVRAGCLDCCCTLVAGIDARVALHSFAGTGTASSAHEYSDAEADTERSLHEELAHGEAHGDLHSKLMLLVAILVLVLAMAVTPFELALALASDVVSAFGGVLAAVSRGSRYLVGTLSETIRMLCGWAVWGTSTVVQAVADTLG